MLEKCYMLGAQKQPPGYVFVFSRHLENIIIETNEGNKLCISLVILTHTRCDNLIPGIVAACRWSVESGKIVYSRTFGHVPTSVYINHRPNESFVPEQQKKYYVSVVHGWWKNE
jgi:hypothetical protein